MDIKFKILGGYMIENFRDWINALLCLGIFTTLIQLIMPKNNIRKYIYSLIGIVTIVVTMSLRS